MSAEDKATPEEEEAQIKELAKLVTPELAAAEVLRLRRDIVILAEIVARLAKALEESVGSS